MPDKYAAYIGSIPKNYDRYLGPLLFEPFALDLVRRINTRNVSSVLELACGTGRVTRHLRNSFPPAVRLVATDLNPDMIAIAQEQVKEAASIEWITADAQHIPFEDASFDVVVCQFGVMFMPDKLQAFREAYRVLKPGGTFLFNTWDAMEQNGAFPLVNQTVGSFFGNDPPIFYLVPFSFHDDKLIYNLSADAGFRDIQLELVSKQGTSDSAAEAAIGFVEGTPVLVALRERNPELVPVVREAVAKAIGQAFGEHPFAMPLQAWICKAIKQELLS